MTGRRKWAIMLASVLTLGTILGTVAFAAGTTAEGDLFEQLRTLRQTRMEQLREESRALVEQAVTDGEITAEQSSRLLSRIDGAGSRPDMGHMGRMGRMGRMDAHRFAPGPLGGGSPEQMQAHLDEMVATGVITQEQADQIREHRASFQPGSAPGPKAGMRGYFRPDADQK